MKKKLWVSTNILLYLRYDRKYGHTSYIWLQQKRIKTCTRSIKWYQWRWTTLNGDCEVMPLFEVEYLRKSTRWRHSYNGILIGTYTPLINDVNSNVLSASEWQQNFRQHGASRGVSATAELLVRLIIIFINCHFTSASGSSRHSTTTVEPSGLLFIILVHDINIIK